MNSDVDLLCVKAEGYPVKVKPKRGVTVHEYSYQQLVAEANAGGLFCLHIVEEALSLSDPFGHLRSLQEEFCYKKSYSREKAEAASIIWYLSSEFCSGKTSKIRKRYVWAIRTLIIADSAENRKPVFGANDLELYSGIKGLSKIIDKRNTIDVESLKNLSRRVVRKYYKLTRPRSLNSEKLVVRWMQGKGRVAGDTPIYIRQISRSDGLGSLYE